MLFSLFTMKYKEAGKRLVKTIDDFYVGQHVTFTKTFTDEDVRRFVEISRDPDLARTERGAFFLPWHDSASLR